MRNILTNPEDMEQFLNIVNGQLDATKQQKAQLESQLKLINGQINEANNTVELLRNWQQVMNDDDLTLIKMAYDDIKKNYKEIITIEDTDETK